MNHLHFSALQAMSRTGIFGKSVTPITFDKCFCDACALGKLTVMSFPKQSLNKATRALGRVATDIAGIFPMRTVRGQRYYQVFVDEMSGTKWVYLMTDKSLKSVMANLQQFRVDVGHHPNILRILRLDNDATFTSSEFREYCRKAEIKLEYCQPHRHQQNGLAERAI
jgi:transposase InsO family protein